MRSKIAILAGMIGNKVVQMAGRKGTSLTGKIALAVIKDILNDFHLKLTEDNTKTPVNMVIYPVMPSLIPKIKNIYKFNLIIRTFDFNGTKSLILNILKNNIEIRKKVFFDIDPMFLD